MACGSGIYTINELVGLTDLLTNAFVDGVASTFAEDHLRFIASPAQAAEPATTGLVLLGLFTLGLKRRRMKA